MTPVDPDSFEDPSLKQLCCNAWRKDCAPKALCERLAKLASDTNLQSIRPPAAFWRQPWVGVAAAAVVLLVSGVAIYFHEPAGEYATINSQLASDMVARHDLCCANHKQHQLAGIPVNDIPLLGKTLSNKLQQPVMVAALPEMGWTLRGGAVCPVGKTPAAHLIFDRIDTAQVSVFSLPHANNMHNGRYEGVVDNHPMAGFVDSRGAFCLVGSVNGSLTPAHLAALRDQMQSAVVMNTPVTQRETVAELLH